MMVAFCVNEINELDSRGGSTQSSEAGRVSPSGDCTLNDREVCGIKSMHLYNYIARFLVHWDRPFQM